ncbi:MAG TPA: GvpL/GvpF family gas vesicle protein [Longimicrobiaceae bacterium]|nr:GvpL/GvpF family gas vesicle protein [Longimicrobiaceae bacterium]
MADRRSAPRVPPDPGARGLRLLGVAHGDRRRGALWDPPAAARYEAQVVRWRDLAALVYPALLRVPELTQDDVLAHHRRLDAMLQRETVLPVPCGVGFETERDVVRFLREQHDGLVEALAYVEGRWEFRLHVVPAAPELPEALAADLATHVYAELRKIAHAALPFPRAESGAFTSAFLVDRAATRPFLDRVDEQGRANPDLSLDATGPWPPYDFVRVTPVEE